MRITLIALGLSAATAVKDTVCGPQGCAAFCDVECGRARAEHPVRFAERFPAAGSDGGASASCAAECGAFFDGTEYDGDKIRSKKTGRGGAAEKQGSAGLAGERRGVGGGHYDSAFVPGAWKRTTHSFHGVQ